MAKHILMGIDCGGTHTDAALLECDDSAKQARLLAAAKTVTRHDNLPASITEAVNGIRQALSGAMPVPDRVTLGTTLEINAIIEDKTDKVGLALTAGPGLDPFHFALGDHFCIVPGGLDHRGVEVTALYTEELANMAAKWPQMGVGAIACVGKFSPRNTSHEEKMAQIAQKASGLPVTMGHTLSGKLNFPRRIATAYYNAAIGRLHENFLLSVEKALNSAGISGQLRLLKADGGAIPFAISRAEPVQSILSGPAASVMGAIAMLPQSGCALLIDIGGTTTDLALIVDGSPVIDRSGMKIRNRHTLVRSLATLSIGIGGDSAIWLDKGKPQVGPQRKGPAMAFGGAEPTLLDALNFLDANLAPKDRGDIAKSVAGIKNLANENGIADCNGFAQEAVNLALQKIVRGAFDLVENINAKPVYTLAALKALGQARPQSISLVGGPAHAINGRIEKALNLPVKICPHSEVANAIGAALSAPTAALEIYVDTGKGELSAPGYDYREKIPNTFTLEEAKERAMQLLAQKLRENGIDDAQIEVTEADLFATLDDYGRGAKDMRVSCQAKPGIVARLA